MTCDHYKSRDSTKFSACWLVETIGWLEKVRRLIQCCPVTLARTNEFSQKWKYVELWSFYVGRNSSYLLDKSVLVFFMTEISKTLPSGLYFLKRDLYNLSVNRITDIYGHRKLRILHYWCTIYSDMFQIITDFISFLLSDKWFLAQDG